MRRFLALAAVLSVCLAGQAVQAQQWGDLTATFVYEGDVPSQAPLQLTKDTEFCAKHAPVDESLVVNSKSKGIANVVAFLYLAKGSAKPAIHPTLQQNSSLKAKLDNNQCRFAPHVVALQTGQTLVMSNSDSIGHNCKIDTLANPPINYTIPAEGQLEQKFAKEERLPAKVSCSIHPWMSGWVVIRDNPYVGVSDENGKLVIKNLPAGKWTFQIWHEKGGYLSRVKQDGKAVEWSKGRLDLVIKPGQNSLGEIKLAPTAFVEQ